MKKLLRLCIFLLLLNGGFLKAQNGEQIRMCTWNLKYYDSTVSEDRNENIIRVLDSINPDILALQGFDYSMESSIFWNNVIHKLENTNEYAEVLANVDPVPKLVPIKWKTRLFFKKTKITVNKSFLITDHYLFDSNAVYHYGQIVSRFVVNKSPADTVTIYAAMWPSRRIEEENRSIRVDDIFFINYIPSEDSDRRVILGALYFYHPQESGYKNNTVINSADPLGPYWGPDSAKYAYMYTSSTRSINSDACSLGEDSVGLRYRFDYILHRKEIKDNYIPNSYTVFGNDGLDRRNSSITDPPNQKVSQEIAEALQCASSHLPVYADYFFGKITSVENSPLSDFCLSFYPNPLKETSTISCSLPADGVVKITLHDMLGREVAVVHDAFKSAGNFTIPFKNESLPNGMYVLKMSAGGLSLTKSVSVVR